MKTSHQGFNNLDLLWCWLIGASSDRENMVTSGSSKDDCKRWSHAHKLMWWCTEMSLILAGVSCYGSTGGSSNYWPPVPARAIIWISLNIMGCNTSYQKYVLIAIEQQYVTKAWSRKILIRLQNTMYPVQIPLKDFLKHLLPINIEVQCTRYILRKFSFFYYNQD